MNGEYMKRYLLVLSLVTFAVLAVYVSAQEIAVRNSSLNGGFAPLSLTLSQPTRGVVFKTAAINSDGTVANCFRCVKATTIHLGTGAYQIAFDVTSSLPRRRSVGQ